jgi:hypothetical protein
MGKNIEKCIFAETANNNNDNDDFQVKLPQNLSQEDLIGLYDNCQTKSIKLMALNSPNFPPKKLVNVAENKSTDSDYKLAALNNPNFPHDYLLRWASSSKSDKVVRIAAINHPKISNNNKYNIAINSPLPEVRLALINNPTVGGNYKANLAINSSTLEIKIRAINDKNITPLGIHIIVLSTTNSDVLREAIKQKDKLLPDTISFIANANCSQEIKDEANKLLEIAKKNKN